MTEPPTTGPGEPKTSPPQTAAGVPESLWLRRIWARLRQSLDSDPRYKAFLKKMNLPG